MPLDTVDTFRFENDDKHPSLARPPYLGSGLSVGSVRFGSVTVLPSEIFLLTLAISDIVMHFYLFLP